MADNNNRVKIVGYAQRTFFNDGIEYRNFSDDLVGNQQTSRNDGETDSLFTMGNFVVTTNLSSRITRNFSTKKFSNFFCLQDIGLTEEDSALLDGNVDITLNLDNSDLCNYAYFGSATEFIRVSLEHIISTWPASLYLTPILDAGPSSLTGYTVEDYAYDVLSDKASFTVNTNFIDNKFDIIYLKNGQAVDSFSDTNNPRNLTINYLDYVIFHDGNEYPLVGFTGATTRLNDRLYFEVIGNPFSTGRTNQYVTYHIKPKKLKVDQFFNSLPPFENNLLNRLVYPKYTSEFVYNQSMDNGIIVSRTQKLTWPVTDGYNIDFNTTQYANYVNKLIAISNAKDAINSNLIVRFLTSESISDFDTLPKCDGSEEESAGQKINRTLKIYGRAFDDVKQWIDGLQWVHTVTYNKKNNAPDQIVKYLAKLLGWELTSSIIENDLLKAYVETAPSTYSGRSRGLTASEAEIELWRRLILNSAWIWKSKGTRKAIEFLFKFIGAPYGLINLNEYVYVAKEPINMEIFNLVLDALNLDSDLDNYLVDSDGYPSFLPDTSDMYFQSYGNWYRETGGSGATEYLLEGNNPHIGPYDGGKAYIAQLQNIIPNFEPVIVTATTTTSGITNLFTNYNDGLMNGYSGDSYVEIQGKYGTDLLDCYTASTLIIKDPSPSAEITDCGCDIEDDDDALLIEISKLEIDDSGPDPTACDFDVDFNGAPYIIESGNQPVTNPQFQFDSHPNVFIWPYAQYTPPPSNVLLDYTYDTVFVSPVCCAALTDSSVGFESYDYQEYSLTLVMGGDDTPVDATPELSNCGYVCCTSKRGLNNDIGKDGCGCFVTCQWRLAGYLGSDMYNDGSTYPLLKFVTPANDWGRSGAPEYRVVFEGDSCFCPVQKWTKKEYVYDPFADKWGWGCRILKEGMDLFSPSNINPTWGTENSGIYQFYYQKSIGQLPCPSEETDFINIGDCSLFSVQFGQIPIVNSEPASPVRYQIAPLIIENGTAPFTFEWAIGDRTGYFNDWGFERPSPLPISQTITTIDEYPFIIDRNGQITPAPLPPDSQCDFPSFTLSVTVTDANGCIAQAIKTCVSEII